MNVLFLLSIIYSIFSSLSILIRHFSSHSIISALLTNVPYGICLLCTNKFVFINSLYTLILSLGFQSIPVWIRKDLFVISNHYKKVLFYRYYFVFTLVFLLQEPYILVEVGFLTLRLVFLILTEPHALLPRL